jgi:hypothetical protein
MNITNAMREDLFTPDSVITEISAHGWTWKGFGALVGLAGGLTAPLAGSLCSVIGWLTTHTWHAFALQCIGTASFVLTLPLLVFGAHCLDLMDGERRSRGDRD